MSSAALGIHPLVDALADRIRLCWQDLPDLQPLEVDPQLEAISGSLDGEDLFIRNELRRSRGLRKLHLETARLGVRGRHRGGPWRGVRRHRGSLPRGCRPAGGGDRSA